VAERQLGRITVSATALLVAAILAGTACTDAARPATSSQAATPQTTEQPTAVAPAASGQEAEAKDPASPAHAATTLTSVKSGLWSDASVWDGTAPTAHNAVTIAPGHHVKFDVDDSTVAGLTIEEGAIFSFSRIRTGLLKSSQNVVVNGVLEMRPISPRIVHQLQFVGIDETKYVGGGMDPLASDVGLWVMGSGRLDLQGSPKRAWTRAAGSVPRGASSLVLTESPAGWQAGDDIVISPTAINDFIGFDTATIAGVSGKSITLSGTTVLAHPVVSFNNKTHTAEVMNLTRNVIISGTKPAIAEPRADQKNTNGGRAHIFIRSSEPQTINYTLIQHVGPRTDTSNCWVGTDCSTSIAGRYGLHFHHALDGSLGSEVRGTVVRDSGAKGFVPHASHGILFKDTIAYAVYEDGYWWDAPLTDSNRTCIDQNCADGISDDTTIDGAVAALIKKDDMASDSTTGFALQKGLGNAIRNSVAVGMQGNISSGGYAWHEGSSNSPWQFIDNLAHNNAAQGIFWWQVDGPMHAVERYTSYRNGVNATKHGAYLNSAHYTDFESYQDGSRSDGWGGTAPFHLIAAVPYVEEPFRDYGPKINHQRWADGYIDVGGVAKYAVHFGTIVGNEDIPILMPRLTVNGFTEKPILIDDSQDNEGVTRADLVCWSIGAEGRDLQQSDFAIKEWDDRIVIRVQRTDGTAFQLAGDREFTKIAKFSDCGSRSADAVRPTAPRNLTARMIDDPVAGKRIMLDWEASKDDMGVTGYRIVRRNWERASTYLTKTSHLADDRLSDATGELISYRGSVFYNITAHDAAGNVSDPSTTLSVDLVTGAVRYVGSRCRDCALTSGS
jgi:hypothetical protein